MSGLVGIDASRANLRQRTGTEWYSLQIISRMVRRHPEVQFVLYLDAPPLPELAHLGPNARLRVLAWPPRLLWSQLRLSWEMLRRPPDILFVPAHTLPIVHPRRTVVTLHDVGFERFPELYRVNRIGGPVLGAMLNLLARGLTLGRYGNSELDYHRWSARFAARHASRLITVSAFTQREITACYGTPRSSITVVPHGFDSGTFTPPSTTAVNAARARFGIGPRYLLFIGRLERKKNVVRMMEVLAAARRELHDLELVLIGQPGLGWDEAETRGRQLGLAPAVRAIGWQPAETYRDLLGGALTLVFLSRYEGFGMPILESFAVGTPVIASTAGSLPEVAGDAAVLVDPDDVAAASAAVVRLATDERFRNDRIARGRRRLSGFDWNRAADQTMSVLQVLADR